MEIHDQKHSPVESAEKVSKGRRMLLKAGWTIPVIAATPLINTAVALSSNDCGDMYARLDEARQNGDKSLYQSLKSAAKDAGCDISNY